MVSHIETTLISSFLYIGKCLISMTQQFGSPKERHIPGNANVLVHVCFYHKLARA